MMTIRTAFISGHLDLTREEFDEHYAPQIEEALKEVCCFVIGDARGCDQMAQQYLWARGYDDLVTIYHMFDAPRHAFKGIALQGGFKSDDERDTAMTEASDYDIAWVRPGRENSGTARNLARRKE
jgi:hypothetical protein